MNCPGCNQSFADDTFRCSACGCCVLKGQMVDKLPGVTAHGLLSTWRLLQLMMAGIVVLLIGVLMFSIKNGCTARS